LTSSNTLPWVTNSVPTAGLSLKAITYGSGMFVAGGQNSSIFTSANGTSWQTNQNAFQSGANVQGLALNAGTFAAVASVLDISTNDLTLTAGWQTVSIPNPVLFESFTGVTPLGATEFAACGIRDDVRVSSNHGYSWNVSRAFDI